MVPYKPRGEVGGSPSSRCVQTLASRLAQVLLGCLYSFQESVAIIFLPLFWPRFIPPTSTAVTSQSFTYHHVFAPYRQRCNWRFRSYRKRRCVARKNVVPSSPTVKEFGVQEESCTPWPLLRLSKRRELLTQRQNVKSRKIRLSINHLIARRCTNWATGTVFSRRKVNK